jgi:hypothetical protein
MADIVDVRTRQRVVIEFLNVEGSIPIETHRHLTSVYGEDAVDVSSVRRWNRCFKGGERDIGDRPRSGRPASAGTTKTKGKFDGLIRDNHRIMTTNSKRSAKQKDALSQTDHTPLYAQGRQLQKWGGLSSLILLTVSIYHPPTSVFFFCPVKDALQGCRFADEDDDELKHYLREELRRVSKEFYATGIDRLMPRWQSVLIMDTLWKNNLTL